MRPGRLLPALIGLLLIGGVGGYLAPRRVAPLYAPTATATAAPTPPTDPFSGSTWRLVAIDGQPPVIELLVTLRFEVGRFRGSTGCNGYGGRYIIGPDGGMTTRELISTAAVCPPSARIAQERRYSDILYGLIAARREGTKLRLTSAAGGELVFAPE